ncbi:MAG: T9SS type A sorting domain-containing protein [Candidatus Marinimicrobia bacterium]|nr:T9SS type A sorting domain-containing protein [Candidatus Neomarinimicrobiota bacterium]
MVKIHIIFIWMVLFFSFYSYGQDIAENTSPSDSAYYCSFFPMHVGDKWVYKSYAAELEPMVEEFVRDTIEADGTHWFMQHETGAYYTINDSFEVIYKSYFSWVNCDTLYKLNANIGECWDRDRQREYCVVDTIYSINYYGTRKMLVIDRYTGPNPCDTLSDVNIPLWMQKTFLVSGIGIIEEWYEGGPGRYLTGAIVDGVIYGNPSDIDIDTATIKVPDYISLAQCYPNPFNQNTTIQYTLHTEGKVTLNIYDLKGRLVKTMIDCIQKEGSYSVEWNGSDANNRKVQSGIYFYEVKLDQFKTIKKMILLK